jgi:hypothetical protein
MIAQHLINLKESQRPENKMFIGKNERYTTAKGMETRKLTRPWDYCWFSNKPHIIELTVEEAIAKYPQYILWCYNNLSIKWSMHTIKLFNKYNQVDDFIEA